jgi:Uncharacterized protein family UPF0016
VIFLGELPDKTMFASLVMATRGRPFAVWPGATTAFAVHMMIATTVGALLLDILPHRTVELAVALTFLVLTGWAPWPERLPWPERRPLCSGGMRGRNPEHFGQSLSRRGKWIIGAICAGALVIFAGVGVWSGLHQGSYDQSRNGCINVSVVSSTGGAVIHACGGKARTICRSAYAHTGSQSRQTRAQCKLAGIGS